jgi:hypothetical protein
VPACAYRQSHVHYKVGHMLLWSSKVGALRRGSEGMRAGMREVMCKRSCLPRDGQRECKPKANVALQKKGQGLTTVYVRHVHAVNAHYSCCISAEFYMPRAYHSPSCCVQRRAYVVYVAWIEGACKLNRQSATGRHSNGQQEQEQEHPKIAARSAPRTQMIFSYQERGAKEIGRAPETLVAERKAPRVAMEPRKLARMA